MVATSHTHDLTGVLVARTPLDARPNACETMSTNTHTRPHTDILLVFVTLASKPVAYMTKHQITQ